MKSIAGERDCKTHVHTSTANMGHPILWRVVLSANYEVGVEVRVRIWEKFRRHVRRMKKP